MGKNNNKDITCKQAGNIVKDMNRTMENSMADDKEEIKHSKDNKIYIEYPGA